MSPEPHEVDTITGFTQLIFQQALSQDNATGFAHGHVPQQSLWPPVVTVLRAPLSPWALVAAWEGQWPVWATEGGTPDLPWSLL